MKDPDSKFVKKLVWSCIGAIILAILFVAGLTFKSLFLMM